MTNYPDEDHGNGGLLHTQHDRTQRALGGYWPWANLWSLLDASSTSPVT